MHRRTPHVVVPARLLVALLLLFAAFTTGRPAAGQSYVPGRHTDWERRAPERVGFNAAALQAAIAFSVASEATTSRDLTEAHYQSFGREPHGEPVGPFKPRGPQTGLVVRHGYIVAEWGDTRQST